MLLRFKKKKKKRICLKAFPVTNDKPEVTFLGLTEQ